MSDLRDNWRDRKAHVQAKRKAESVLCWQCGKRVWQDEAKCSGCGTTNDMHKGAK